MVVTQLDFTAARKAAKVKVRSTEEPAKKLAPAKKPARKPANKRPNTPDAQILSEPETPVVRPARAAKKMKPMPESEKPAREKILEKDQVC